MFEIDFAGIRDASLEDAGGFVVQEFAKGSIVHWSMSWLKW